MIKFLITLFFGWAGVHKFIDGKKGMGLLYLCTVGIGGIGWITDIIIAARVWRKEISVQTTQHTYNREYDSAYSKVQKYREYQEIVRPHVNKYFRGLEEIESMWSVLHNLKITSGEKADLFEEKCKQNLDDLYFWIAIAQKYGPNESVPPHVPAFVRLAMLYEKQERYEDAINICVEAIKVGATSDGNNGKMYGRLARLIRKSGLTVTDEIMQLSMKTE